MGVLLVFSYYSKSAKSNALKSEMEKNRKKKFGFKNPVSFEMSKSGGEDNEQNDTRNTGTGTDDDCAGQCVEPEVTKKSKITLFQERFDSAKVVINKRHKLIISILSVLVFILLIIVIILAVSLGNSSNYAQEICVTSACSSAASSIVLSVNTSTVPCNDFWSYSCGGWITSHPLPDNRGSYSVRDEMERRINHDIRHYIDLIRVDDEQSHTPEWKIITFYQSCMKGFDYSDDFVEEIFTHFASWQRSWSFAKSLETLFAIYGVDAFFSISVDTDDKNGESSFIKIEPSVIGLPHRDLYNNPQYETYTKEYKRLITDVVQQLDIEYEDRSFADNVYSFEERLSQIMPTVQQMQSPKDYVRVLDLKLVMPFVNWTQLLRTIYKKGNVEEATYILVSNSEYFVHLDALLLTIDKELMNDYFVWRIIYAYLPYLSRELSALHNQFVQRMNGANNTFLGGNERWEFCIRTTTKFLGEAVGALYNKNRIESEADAVNDVTKMIEIMCDTLVKNLDSYPWIRDGKSLTTIRRKVEQMCVNSSIGVGYPKFVTDMKSVEAYYNDYVVTENFLMNIINGFTFKRKAEERRLTTSISSSNNSWNIIPTDIKVYYKLAGNQLFVASGLFRYPFYEHDLPIPMKFGALGFQVASQMLRVINSEGLIYDPHGKLLEMDLIYRLLKSTMDNLISKNTFVAQSSSEKCLGYDINDYQARHASDFHVDTSLTAAQSFADVLGLQLVYDSYKKYSMKHSEGGIFPSLSRSNDELFFISLAQSMCETMRPEYARLKYKSLTTLPAQQRIELMFRQSKQFQSTFKCEENKNTCDLGLNKV